MIVIITLCIVHFVGVMLTIQIMWMILSGAMKTQSAKAKGRRLQQWVVKQLIETFDIHPEDIKSCSMGAGGEDVVMARAAREKFPYSVECKNVEKLNVWDAYDQAKANAKDYEPIVVMKKNGKKPLVIVDAEYFINLNKEKKNR